MTFFRALSVATLLIPILLLLGIVMGIFYYAVLKMKYRLLLFYLAGCLVTDILCRVAGELYRNNLMFIILFSLFELVFFSIFYQINFFKRKVPLYSMATVTGAVFVVYELYSLKNFNPVEFQTYSKISCLFIIIIMAIHYFFEKINKNQLKDADMRLNAVCIIYFSITLILFLPVNFLINVDSSVKFYFWLINLITTMLFYLFLIQEIWKNGSTQKQLQSGS